MTYRGVARGKTIELEEALPFVDGQPVSVSVELLPVQPAAGSPEAVRHAMRQPPHLRPEDVDELEALIREGQLPVS